MHAVRPTGPAYLALVTDLLQRRRLAHPVDGLYEAADLQWSYTRDQHPDDANAVVWIEDDVPVTAVAFHRRGTDGYGCDVLGDPTTAAWEYVRRRCAELAPAWVEMEIDPAYASDAAAAGFTEPVGGWAISWLDAGDRPAVRPLPDGYALAARPDQDGPHPMVARNGAAIEEHLRACSLYDPALDLALVTDSGEVAGYALFWADVRTRVGMLEPMRIEQPHGGQGLAGTLVRAGLDALAARGCDRFKVLNDVSNPVAAGAYAGAGFRPERQVEAYRRTPG